MRYLNGYNIAVYLLKRKLPTKKKETAICVKIIGKDSEQK